MARHGRTVEPSSGIEAVHITAPLGAEQALIEAAWRRLGVASGGRVIAGPGHDCAVIELGAPGASGLRLNSSGLAITTDTFVEGVHFSLKYATLADAGYRALMANLSDLAAAGSMPLWALASLGAPPGASAAQKSELLDGIAAAIEDAAAQGSKLAVLGGDTFAAPQWIISFTLFGEVGGAPLLRSGANPGDQVWLAGTPGLSQLGLCALHGGLSGYERSKHAHLRPMAQTALGMRLQREGLASACIDLSDSMSQCLLLLAEASSVGLSLDLSRLNLHPEVEEFIAAMRGRLRSKAHLRGFSTPAKLNPGGKVLKYASREHFLLSCAEDYSLLFTAPPSAARSLVHGATEPLCLIGTVVDKGEGCHWRGSDGHVDRLSASGYAHFA